MNNGLSRREFVTLVGAGVAAAIPARAQSQPSQTLYAYVGSLTAGGWGIGGGGGISVHTVDMSDGSLTQVSRTGPEFDNLSAGYQCISPGGRFLYSSDQVRNLHGETGAGGGLLSFAIDQGDGSIGHMNTQPSMGVNPAYIAMDATGSWLVAANHANYDAAVTVVKTDGVLAIRKVYDDGTVSILPVREDGTLGFATDVAILERTGSVDPYRQANAHAHCVNFDPSNRFVLICDKGADRLYVYRVDHGTGTFTDGKFFPTKPGVIPRHNKFHPTLPYAFVIHEHESSLSSYHFDSENGDLTLIETVPTVPADFDGVNSPADVQVHPNGRFVYGSNRGHDSIAIFAIDEATGRLTPAGIVSTGGQRPRGFRIEPTGTYLFAGNQDSDSVVTFVIDPDSGMLTPTGARANIPRPVCFNFLWL